jgi:DNA polymerase-3 subunit gamma/tau
MEYKVLSHKYRPQTFSDVVGQDIVTRTLENSIKNGRIANAYIFCGPRGVGKTTVARLLSKTLNCEAEEGERPCNACSSCLEITADNNIDVIEIDGASNNRVDEIRVLLENVRFSPSRSRYKIYIIDEVHMLSTGAFNALLKTLEEPPGHVKFIFATTEHNKVLPTIMSRCQRFDFRRIPPALIRRRLGDIAEKENISLEDNAALLIARSADGSLRDALVILDQMISYSGREIKASGVSELLGVVEKERIFDLAGAVIEKNAAKAIDIVDSLVNSGKEPVFLANTLAGHFRDLLVFRNTGKPTRDMVFSGEEIERVKKQAGGSTVEELIYILQSLMNCVPLMKSALFARAPLEIVLVKLTKRDDVLSIGEVLKGVKKKAITPVSEAPAEQGLTAAPLQTTAAGDGDMLSGVKERPFSLSQGDAGSGSPDLSDEEADELPAGASPSGELNWQAVLKYLKNKKMSVYTILNNARPLEIASDRISLGLPREEAFKKEMLEYESNRDLVEEAVKTITGRRCRIEYVLIDLSETSVRKKEEDKEDLGEIREKLKPVVDKAMEIFGGHVVRDISRGRK